MTTYERNKGVVTIHIEGKAKPYILDVNNGSLIGMTNKQLQTIPPMLGNALYAISDPLNVLTLLRRGYLPNRRKELFLLADKLDSLGYTKFDYSALLILWENASAYEFKELAKYLAEHEDYRVNDFITEVVQSKWRQTHKLTVDEHLTEEMVDWLYRNRESLGEDNIGITAYWLAHGVWEFYDHMGHCGYMRSYIRELLSWASHLGIKPEKSDFFRQYINLQRAYRLKVTAERNAAIKAYQDYQRVALTFETDKFIVVIPTTNEELIQEGNNQSNCVGGYGQRIADRNRNVVFIRRKENPTKSYITCDICYNGGINQFLLSYNRGVGLDSEEFEFKKLYQEHLHKYWVAD